MIKLEAAQRLNAAVGADWQAKIKKEIKKLQDKYKLTPTARRFMVGYCAVFCVDLYQNKLVPPGFVPFSVLVGDGGEEHVILMNKDRDVIDPTGNQFELPIFDKFNTSTYKSRKRLTARELELVREEALDILQPKPKKPAKKKPHFTDNWSW